MPEGNEDEYFLADMSEEEKDDLIKQPSFRYNTASEMIVALHNSFIILSLELERGDVFGQRAKYMRSVAQRMDIIAALVRSNMGVDEQQLRTDAQFEDIVAGLDLEDPDDE